MIDESDIKRIEDIFARHIGILVENFQHKLDIVVEGHQMLHDKIDHVQQELTGLTARVDRIELVVLRMEKRQANLEQRQTNLEQRQMNLEQHQMNLEQHQMNLEQRQMNLEQHQTNLEQRQEKLEQTIKEVRIELGEKIDHLSSDLADHRADTEVHREIARRR